MSEIVFVSLKEPKERLKNIRNYLPDTSENLEKFIKYLFKYLPPQRISPQGFIKIWDRAYSNIRSGREGHKPLRHPLVGMSGLEYFLILCSFRSVAKAIFPPYFSSYINKLEHLRINGSNTTNKLMEPS